jgi:hypothetical protein
LGFRNTAGRCSSRILLEASPSLIKDAKHGLDGNRNASVVMVVKLEESPIYRNPIQDMDDEELPEVTGIGPDDFSQLRPAGPVTYRGLTWIGTINGVVGFR